MVVMYLLRAGVRKLQDYFASATRPAAILLLLQALNDADMIRQYADQMRHLISKALPSQTSRIGQMTPLGMLHKMTTGFMPQGAVESALGYDPQYLDRAVAQPIGVSYMWTPWNFSESVFRNGPVQPGSQIWSFPPTVVTPAMDRKRGIPLVDAPGDSDSPTKRQRGDEDRTEHFGTCASNEGRFVPLETDSSQPSPLDHPGGKVFSSDSYELDSDSSAPPTHGKPTVVTAAESECEDLMNDIVNGDDTTVRYDPAFAATPNTLRRKRGSSDRSQLGKRALVKPLLRKQGDEGFVPHEKHPANPGRQCNNTHAVRKNDTSKGLRFLHFSTETASAGSPSDGPTQHDPPVSHAGPGQGELERGTEITLSAKFRLDVESLVCIQRLNFQQALTQAQVNELESKGEALWTGERGPAAIAGYCGPSSIRKLAARDDDKLNDEIVNTIPIIAIPADSRIYLLPSYAFEHIRKEGGEGGEGDSPADHATDPETTTGKRDANSIIGDTATTPLSKAQTKNPTSSQLELRERMDSIVHADVDGHRKQAERTSGPGEGPHAKNTSSAEKLLSPSASEPATSLEARSCPISSVATNTILGYHSDDRRPETSQGKFSRVTALSVEEVAHPHSARLTIVQPGTDVTFLDESEDVNCDQLGYMSDLGFPAAGYNRPHASGYAYQPDCSALGDAPTQSIPNIGGSALLPGARNLGDDAGLLPSPGLPLSTHFEDALGEGLDSWYVSVEVAMARLPTMPASPSMSEWEDLLQSRGSLDVDC
ncbi:hypothetical protein LTR82_017764 [Friedmanniomyces endolithicus]|uniref:Uncharacterized protein n=1 Tax=Friedmanniomyces endolithicus TaxID=329885 RepID=A0AAN6F542_9PEZI|nr:hypothetical protein LTR82_017764 [Friedmanniomyces endolithicus]